MQPPAKAHPAASSPERLIPAAENPGQMTLEPNHD
jgi:hypothetical protein